MTTARTELEIREQVVRLVAEATGVGIEEIDLDAELFSFGLDSVKAFTLTGDMGEWLDRELSAALLWEHPTIRSLSAFLATELAEEQGA